MGVSGRSPEPREEFIVNFADGNRDRANSGGFFRFDSLSDLWATAQQLADAGYRVWFDGLPWLQPPVPLKTEANE